MMTVPSFVCFGAEIDNHSLVVFARLLRAAHRLALPVPERVLAPKGLTNPSNYGGFGTL